MTGTAALPPRSTSQREILGDTLARKTIGVVIVAMVAAVLAGFCVFGAVQQQAPVQKEYGRRAAQVETKKHTAAGRKEEVLRDREAKAASHQAAGHKEEVLRDNEAEAVHRTSDNSTDVEHNESQPEQHRELKRQDHHHKNCTGGPAAACSCILKCKVFGGDPDLCHGKSHAKKRDMVDDLIRSSMMDHRDMCEGMRCVKACAEELGCMDAKVRRDCRLVEKNYELHRNAPEPECRLDCAA